MYADGRILLDHTNPIYGNEWMLIKIRLRYFKDDYKQQQKPTHID